MCYLLLKFPLGTSGTQTVEKYTKVLLYACQKKIPRNNNSYALLIH